MLGPACDAEEEHVPLGPAEHAGVAVAARVDLVQDLAALRHAQARPALFACEVVPARTLLSEQLSLERERFHDN